MRWLDTDTLEKAGQWSKDFWCAHAEDVRSDTFWADQIKALKDKPAERLRLALDNLPLPAAFREALIALRAIIRTLRKQGADWHEPLGLLYRLAAYESFMLDYAPRLKEPGYNVIESIPGRVIQELEFSYQNLGYNQLRLLGKTDAKWLVEAWGEPDAHTTLNTMHRWVWDQYEDALIEKRREASDQLCRLASDASGDTRSLRSGGQSSEPRRRWWKFW